MGRFYLAGVLVVAFAIGAMSEPLVTKNNGTSSILVYCAAGMRMPVEKIAKEFEAAKGAKVELTYDGSNKLLGQMELARKGDVYISGDADYVEMARKKGFVASEKVICRFVPVIMVKKGNPKGIKSLADLLKPGVKIGQGDPKSAAVGRVTVKVLALNAIDTFAWKKNVVVSTGTVNELGNAIKLGTIDAAIVWNAIAASYPEDASVVGIDTAKNILPNVDGAVLTFSKNQAVASSFLEYLVSEQARKILTESGYTVGNAK